MHIGQYDADPRLQLLDAGGADAIMASNPNYLAGYGAGVITLGIQRTLPQGVVLLNFDYTGAYAGNLDIVRAPPTARFNGVSPSYELDHLPL